MRILCVGSMYPPQHLGGYELIFADCVRELRARGHDVRVLASDLVLHVQRVDDVHRELRRYWDGDVWPRLSPAARLRVERENAATLDRHLREHAPDAVCWFNMGGLSMGLLERVRRAGIPALAYVADDWLRDGPRRDAWQRAWAQRPRAARLVEALTGLPTRVDYDRAARWLFISDATRRASGRKLSDASVAHAGVHADFAPAPRPPWRWKLLYAGRVVADKGVDLAVGALAHLPREATLTIAGPDGNAREAAALEGLIAQLGVGARVRRRSALARHELADAYADADVVLFPSRWAEPWGLVPLEAMAVGAPVIASGTGGSAEYLRDGENALVVAPEDPAAWGAAVRRLVEDEALRARLRSGGRATAERHPADLAPRAVAQALQELVGHDVPDITEEAAA
jgi:glycosyltransferase involved in cell wall biosynthesis